MSDINQRVACKAVIAKDGKVLVLREATTYADGTATGRWTCPGGRIEPGEHFADGLRREVREETGLDVAVGDPLHVDEWFPVIQGQQSQIVAIYFECAPQADTVVRLSAEHDEYRWVNDAEAETLDIMDAERQAFRKFFAN